MGYTSGGSGGGGGGGATTIVKPADTTKNNTNAYSSDPHLTFEVEANSTYFIEIHLLLSCTSTVPDWGIAFTKPAGVVLRWGSEALILGADTYGWWAGSSASTNAVFALQDESSARVFESMNSPRQGLHLTAILITGGTAGTFALEWTQGTATAVDSTVKAGSLMRYEKVA